MPRTRREAGAPITVRNAGAVIEVRTLDVEVEPELLLRQVDVLADEIASGYVLGAARAEGVALA